MKRRLESDPCAAENDRRPPRGEAQPFGPGRIGRGAPPGTMGQGVHVPKPHMIGVAVQPGAGREEDIRYGNRI